jgi:hypothetical protein
MGLSFALFLAIINPHATEKTFSKADVADVANTFMQQLQASDIVTVLNATILKDY